MKRKDNLVEELNLIQTQIQRMAGNSFIGLASVFMSFGTKFATISIKSMATH